MATVKVRDKEYPIGATMWALLQFKRDKGKDVSELADTDLEDMLYYTWLCVKGACQQSNVAFEESWEDYLMYVEGDPTEALIVAKLEALKKKKEQGNANH